jgi:hypothetical protein
MSPLAQNIAGWGRDWITCPECIGMDDCCMECGGEGGWPASASRFDDEPEVELEEDFYTSEAAE